MKTVSATLTAIALSIAAAPTLAADPVAGKAKAAGCVACHGDQSFGGIFYTLQLAGRNADRLEVKTNKYKSGKILHPIMNLATVFMTEQDIADVSAYYQSLGKPAFVPPFVEIKGDDDAKPQAQSTPATPVSGWSNVASYK